MNNSTLDTLYDIFCVTLSLNCNAEFKCPVNFSAKVKNDGEAEDEEGRDAAEEEGMEGRAQ